MSVRIVEAPFSAVLPIWRDELWPGRQSAIEAVSVIAHDGAISLIASDLQPVFFVAKRDGDDDSILGVNSGFRTSLDRFRSRGLWVCPALRGGGIGRRLIEAVRGRARSEGCAVLWSMARDRSLGFYLSCGFRAVKSIDAYEFGPHTIVETSASPLLLPP